MKVRKHAPVQEDTGIDLAPMLDFIMNLLIFFIVTTTFVNFSGINVQRPTASTAQPQERTSILVAVSDQGEVWVDGHHVDVRNLRLEIQRLRAANPESAVIVEADTNARAGLVVEAMDQVRLAGVKNVAIAADRQ